MTAAMGSIAREREMQAVLHDILAERAQLRARVHELTIELELARQMQRIPPAATVSEPARSLAG